MHPFDAGLRSIDDGDAVSLRTEGGEMPATARLDSDLRIGAVSVPHGWRAPSVNNLLSGEHNVDRLTGMPLMSGVPVTVFKRS
jgi:predicted molibdopterin-dependent oxidoreductase YjgC